MTHPPFLRAPLQPLLARVVRGVAARNPRLFDRLGPHARSVFLIEPRELPFGLLLRPDPEAPSLRAVSRRRPPPCDARIAGRFLDLMELIDSGSDGDALFFSRGLDICGDVEAVVSLRNALEEVDGSLAVQVAAMFGMPGRAALAGLRALAVRRAREAGA